MDFFNQEITFDIGHVLLFLAIFGVIVYVLFYRKSEGLDVDPVVPTLCKCPACADECLRRAQNNELYGCSNDNPLLPHSDGECILNYRKCLLSCGVQ